ncbi:MAG TPA: hypothetical protein VFJ06_04140 [Halococcus sp.]|nr:hypothetical protein [Halococcus sp.]
MTANGPSTETVPANNESTLPASEGHPLLGWIIAAVFCVGTFYMTFANPWPAMAAEWFYAIIFGVVTVIAAGYALHEHGYLRL